MIWGHVRCFFSNVAKNEHPKLIKEAEVEEDLLEIMLTYWKREELVMKLFFQTEGMSVFKEGWTEGFFDIIFPLRHYA